MVRTSLFHGDVICARLYAVICTYALAGARGECLCAIVRLYVLLCSVCGSLPGTLWSRFVESCRDLMFS